MTQRFFDFMSQEHGLTLLEGEMTDIINEAVLAAKEIGMAFPGSINSLSAQAHENAKAKGFYTRKRNIGRLIEHFQ